MERDGRLRGQVSEERKVGVAEPVSAERAADLQDAEDRLLGAQDRGGRSTILRHYLPPQDGGLPRDSFSLDEDLSQGRGGRTPLGRASERSVLLHEIDIALLRLEDVCDSVRDQRKEILDLEGRVEGPADVVEVGQACQGLQLAQAPALL